MAFRYAVGVAGTGAFAWNGTAGTKWSTTDGGTGGSAIPVAADDVYFTASTASATYTVTRSVTGSMRSLNLAVPSSGTLSFVSTTAITIGGGGLVIPSTGVDITGWTSTITFNASTTLNIPVTLNNPTIFATSGQTYTFGSDYRTLGAVTHNSGVNLNLNGFQLYCKSYTTSGASPAPTLTFGTGGNIYVNATAGGSVVTTTANTITFVGTPLLTVNCNNFSVTIATGSTAFQATLLNTGTTNTATISGTFASLSLTGYNAIVSNAGLTFNGSFTIPSNIASWTGSSNLTMQTSTTSTLTTNGFTLGGSLLHPGIGTLVLGDNVTSSSSLSFTGGGTLNLNGKTLTVTTIARSGTPKYTAGGGRIKITGVATLDATSVTYNDAITFEFTTAATGAFRGPGSANLTLQKSGGGTLQIQGATGAGVCRVANIISAATTTLEQGTTFTVDTLTITGGTFQSTVPGTAAIVSAPSGVITFANTTIKDITATGGATFLAPTTSGNVDGGGNTGIDFSPSGGSSVAETATATDTQSVTLDASGPVAESATVTDTQSAGFAATAAVAETATVTDTQSTITVVSGAIAETASATDTQSATIVSPSSVIAETASVTDTQSAAATAAVSVSEAATATDTQSTTITGVASVAETEVATDSQSGTIVILAAVAETATVTDTQSSTFSRPVQVDVSGVTAVAYLGETSELVNSNIYPSGVQARGYIGSVPVWGQIIDDQTANWGPVDDSQPDSWVPVVDDNTVVWVPISI